MKWLMNLNLLKPLISKINIVIDALYLHFKNSSTTGSIAKSKRFKIFHVAIYKWIKGFEIIFKEIVSTYMLKNLNSSDEWHVDETVIKIPGKRYYIWTLIDSETRYVLHWYLTTSREAT